MDGTRQFYSTPIPQHIQIEDHAYIEADLCELFSDFMLFAWVSAQNCSNIMNAAIKRNCRDEQCKTLFISSEQVSRAFYLNALLRDSAERGEALVLPDIGDNDDRLKLAMEVRNKRIISQGQLEQMHACSKCERFLPGNGYNGLRAFLISLFTTLPKTQFFYSRFIPRCCYRRNYDWKTMLQGSQLYTISSQQSSTFLSRTHTIEEDLCRYRL